MTTVTDRLYSQNTRAVVRAARAGPVFITSRGEPTHVLMTHKEYERLAERANRSRSLAERADEPKRSDGS